MRFRLSFAIILLAFPAVALAKPIELTVDASEVTRRIIHVREVIPAEPGPTTLHYPKWIPGRHRPVGQISNVANLRITANGEPVAWKRAEDDAFTINLTAPKDAKEITVTFDLLLAAGSEGGAMFMTVASPKVMTMNWNDVLVYPKTAKPLELVFKPVVKLADGWKFGTALTTESEKGGLVQFKEAPLGTLIDSPLLAGEHVREVQLGDAGHRVVMACDSPDGLDVPEATIAAWKRLPGEAAALFGPAKPYQRYTFLLGLSNHIPRAGIEHHESSDNRLGELAMIKSADRRMATTLFPHEFVHAWNGKFRRPADMIVNDYQTPHQTRLLWVYEGLTNYLGWLLASRTGLFAAEDAREYLGLTAARMSNSRGRAWRPLDDTAAAAHVLFDAPTSWRSTRRTVDFYDEGTLLWLEADTIIRMKTKGAKSLDDFCKAFFGGGQGFAEVKGYALADVIAALKVVEPTTDWKAHFARRVEVPADAPLDGITNAGWKLTFAEKPSDLFVAQESTSRGANLTDSIGLLLGPEGAVADVVPERAAAKSGLAPGMKVVAVNGRRFSADSLKAAVANTKSGGKLELLAESGDFFKTHALDYKDGAKYPRLEKSDSATDLLAEIVNAKAK